MLGDCPERVLLEQALARGPGGANNPEGLGGHTGKTAEPVVNRDTVTVDKSTALPPRQGGNSTAYAVRRLARERMGHLQRERPARIADAGLA